MGTFPGFAILSACSFSLANFPRGQVCDAFDLTSPRSVPGAITGAQPVSMVVCPVLAAPTAQRAW